MFGFTSGLNCVNGRGWLKWKVRGLDFGGFWALLRHLGWYVIAVMLGSKKIG